MFEAFMVGTLFVFGIFIAALVLAVLELRQESDTHLIEISRLRSRVRDLETIVAEDI